MKHLTSVLFLFLSFSLLAQEQIVFEHNKKTEQLFDESNPLSFISILQQNASYLSHYTLKGIDPAIYKGLSAEEKKSAFKFIGSESGIPLVDEFGESVIITNADGTQSYLYPLPDSMFIDLHDIDKIVFTLHDGDEAPMERLDELQLWKNYTNGMSLTLTLDASTFMTFEGVHLVLPLEEEQTNKLVGASGETALWTTLRDSCLSEMKWFQSRMKDGVFIEEMSYASCRFQHFFPHEWQVDFRLDGAWMDSLDREPFYHPYFEYEDIFPFSIELSNAAKSPDQNSENLVNKFNATHYITSQSSVPLVDEYGDYLTTFDDGGMPIFVYPEPEKVYFFIDYTPTIFVAKQVIRDKQEDFLLTPNQFFFCIQDGEGNPELVSSLNLDREYLKPFLTDFQPQELWSIPEFAQLKSMINNKKYRSSLSFEESTIPCEPCSNKKGKYALCWKGKKKTKYQYHIAPVELSDGSFIARKGNLTYLLDSKGKELFSAELDTIYAPKEYKGTYLGQKDDHWMIYSKSGEYTLPMTHIPDGINVFGLHKYQATKLNGKYFVVEGENGKKGIVDVKGNVLLPFEFSDLHADSTYGEINNEWSALSRAVGRRPIDTEWTVFDANFQAQGTIASSRYFGAYGDFILFRQGEQIEAYHSLTLFRDLTAFSHSSETHIFKENRKGLVDRDGNMILPAEYEHIRKKAVGNKEFYFCTTHKDRLDIFGVLDKSVASFSDVDHSNLMCQEDSNYYTLFSAKGGARIIRFDSTKNTFVMLFDAEFVHITCNSLDPKKPLATGIREEVEGRKKYNLFRDGRMEPID